MSLLGLSAIVGQRIQNRIVTASADIRQAQLNAQAAVELGRLIIEQDAAWRTTYDDLDQPWFTAVDGRRHSKLGSHADQRDRG